MRGVALVCALTALCAGCGGGSGSGVEHPQQPLRGTELSPPIVAPPIVLDDQHGNPVSLAARRGKWVLVTFLYTQCPDVCPIIAGNLNQALKAPAARRAGLSVIAVSVDPARDTPAAVSLYARRHRLLPAFHYLIGARPRLARVWRGYHIAVLAGSKSTVTHSAVTFLVDPEGQERVAYSGAVLTGSVLHDLGLLEQG